MTVLDDRIDAAMYRDYYAKHRPASGQKSLWGEEQERQHPRNDAGEFREKGVNRSTSESVKPDGEPSPSGDAKMNTDTDKKAWSHKWEEIGGWKPPYRFVGMISMPSNDMAGSNPDGYNNAMRDAHLEAKAFGIDGLGSCDVCGTGIHNHCIIRDASGNHFKVGCDCVAKHGDAELTTAAEKAEKARLKEIKNKKNAEKWESARLARVEAVKAEREANGGKTLSEIANEKREAEKESNRKTYTEKNGWILDVLDGMSGDFCDSMVKHLEVAPLKDLSGRCVSIIRDIWAKSHGRSGSRKYAAAYDEFTDRAELENDE